MTGQRDGNLCESAMRLIGFLIALWLLCGNFAMAETPSGGESLRDANRHYQRGEFDKARRIWEAWAEQGSSDAWYGLGQLYRRGEGVEKDVEKARWMYRKAAELGHGYAQSNLGTLYFMDKPPNMEEAIRWWTKGAENGEVHSQYRMGVLYFNGDDVPVDRVRGYAWMKHAASQGHTDAPRLLEEMERYMTTSELDEAEALMPGLLRPEQAGPVVEVSQAPGTPAPPVRDEEQPAPPVAVEPVTSPVAEKSSVVRGYVLQFGAFAKREAAERLWRSLGRDYRELMSGMQPLITELARKPGDNRGVLYRLQGAGAFTDRDDAVTRCEALKRAGVSCFVTVREAVD